MIYIENVTKRYKNFTAVDDLNIKIEEGKIIGLIGPNGAGKTTTISMMIGLTDITQGDITINNISIKEKPIDVKKQIGYVSDDENQLLSLKAIEYLNFVADMYKVPEDERKKRILDLSERFSIKDDLSNRMDKFSKGMKQKIMVIASLLHTPKVWILDEPFDGLDPKTSYELKVFMREYAEKGNTIILSSHILQIVENLCDEVILIKKGKSLYFGSLKDLKERFGSRYNLEEIYMEMFEDKKVHSFSRG